MQLIDIQQKIVLPLTNWKIHSPVYSAAHHFSDVFAHLDLRLLKIGPSFLISLSFYPLTPRVCPKIKVLATVFPTGELSASSL